MVPPFVRGGAEVAERRVASAWIVERLAEVEDGHVGLGVGAQAGAGDQLAFEGGEEGLDEGIVVAIADRAHRDADPGLTAAAAEGQTGVLAAVVRVVDQDGRRAAFQSAMSRASTTSSARRW